jgi:cell division protein FtsB
VRRLAWVLLASVTVVGVLLLFVFPARTLLGQDRDIVATEQRIGALDHESALLKERVAALRDPATVERIARERYGLTLPGRRAFVILPSTSPIPASGASAPGASASGASASGASGSAAHGHASHPWWQALEFWR